MSRTPLWHRIFGRKPRTAFISGSAEGAVIENVTTSADVFVRGSAKGASMENVVHQPRDDG